MSTSLAGRRLLVVGASAGIGRSVALHAAELGARVAFCGRRRARLDEAVAQAGGGVAIVADITDPDQCVSLAAQAADALGSIDLLVMAAGVSRLGRLRDTDAAGWRSVLDANVIGPNLVVRAALPYLTEQAVVAVLSSESVGAPYEGIVPYTASKAALEETIRGWRVEHPNRRFSCVTVGVTDGTDFAREFDPELAAELFPVWIAGARMPANTMAVDELGSAIARTLAVAVDSPGLDCQHLTFRAPGGPYIGDTGWMFENVERAADATS